MGFWQGLNAGLSSVLEEKARKEERQQEIDLRAAERAEDRKERRDALNTELFERYRTTVLEVAAKRGEEGKEQDKKIRLAGQLGLKEFAVDSLLRSGQLDLFISAYEKNQKVDPVFVNDLNNLIETQLKDAAPGTVAGALVAGVSTDRDVTDRDESQLAITEAIISASTPEELDDLYTKLLTAGETYTPLPRFDVDFSTVAGLELPETAAMDRELARGLSAYFKDSFIQTESGDLVINQKSLDSPVVQQIFNEAQRKARELSSGPARDFTPTGAANFVVTQLETAIAGTKGQAKPVDLLTNFDEILANPGGFVEAYQPPPIVDTPEVVTPEGNVEALGDTGFNYIVESTN